MAIYSTSPVQYNTDYNYSNYIATAIYSQIVDEPFPMHDCIRHASNYIYSHAHVYG